MLRYHVTIGYKSSLPNPLQFFINDLNIRHYITLSVEKLSLSSLRITESDLNVIQWLVFQMVSTTLVNWLKWQSYCLVSVGLGSDLGEDLYYPAGGC
jgi:hypothetical protein